jgi:hypothetical protein
MKEKIIGKKNNYLESSAPLDGFQIPTFGVALFLHNKFLPSSSGGANLKPN